MEKMERTKGRDRLPREKTHWGTKLLACAWISALLFVVGMVVGGMLNQEGHAEDLYEGEPEQKILDAPFIDQREEFPTGCESVSAVMALQHAGVEVTVREFIDSCLPQGPVPENGPDGILYGQNPREAFLGSPYSESGWGCYAPVIQKAMDALLAEKKAGLAVTDASGKTLEELCQAYISRDMPVIVWTTMYMEEPSFTEVTDSRTGQPFSWVSPEHCLLLVGADQQYYYFNDPLAGKAVPYEKAAAEAAYQALGCQALVLEAGRPEGGGGIFSAISRSLPLAGTR